MAFRVHRFNGGSSPYDPDAYFNRRAEVWSKMGEWLKAGAETSDDPELDADLTSVQYGYSANPTGEERGDEKAACESGLVKSCDLCHER